MKKEAFTLAEVLATLSVIGIVAAILIPSVIVNYKNHVFRTAHQTVRTMMTDATRNMIAMESRLNKAKSILDENNEDENKTANQIFIQDYFAKYIKFAKICNPDIGDGIYDCGWSNEAEYAEVTSTTRYKIPTTNSEVGFDGNDKMWAATTANGISMLVAYNPNCTSLEGAIEEDDGTTGIVSVPNRFNPQKTACMNVLYDINGTGAPNTFGKDVGYLTVFYPKRAKVGLPIFANNIEFKSGLSSYSDADKYCTTLSSKKDLMLPTLEEAASIYLNSKIMLNETTNKKVWFSNANDEKFSSFSANEAVCVIR